MLRIFGWSVNFRCNSGRFFNPICSRYLSGILVDSVSAISSPMSSDVDCVCYRFGSARFISRELRRCGYYAYVRPYLFFLIRSYVLKKRSSSWK